MLLLQVLKFGGVNVQAGVVCVNKALAWKSLTLNLIQRRSPPPL